MGAVRSGFGCLSWVGAGIIVIALVLKVALFDMAEVGHNGMAPTLLRGERVLINKRATAEIGSIAVCRHPSEDGWVVGRVAATQGMTLDSFGSELRVDGEPVVFNREGETSFYNVDNDSESTLIWGDEYFGRNPHRIFMAEGGRHLVQETEVEEGELYLLGDFRAYRGQDSRAYGVVQASTCRGMIVFRLTPVDGLEGAIAHRYFQLIR
ncbi:MAG: signal peptidase I [Myxococcales bacterium]|nr:MAG: signal peptidase I [Myxococcales bacterium]